MRASALFIYILLIFGQTAIAQFVKIYDFTHTNDISHPWYTTLVYDGTYLYGMCTSGEEYSGSVFRIMPDGTGYSTLVGFTGTANGSSPFGSLTLSGTVLYGMTSSGGANNGGCIFKVNTDGSGYVKLYDFSFATGSAPNGSLTLSGTVLYGMTRQGGASSVGTIFKINTDGTGYTTLLNFSGTANGSQPNGDLLLSGAVLYGMTLAGGSNGFGCIFKINTDGTGYTKLLDCTFATGGGPYGTPVLSGSTLYAAMSAYGANFKGSIIKINTDATGYGKLYDFTGATGQVPNGSLAISGSVLYGMASQGGANSEGCIFSINTDGTGYADLLDFSGVANGASPKSSLLLSGGVLYGMTSAGGANNLGTIFKINTNGTGYTKLIDCSYAPNGWSPLDLTYGGGTILYGMTYEGGANGYGTIYKINTDGTGYTKLFDFDGTNGANPWGKLLLSGSVLYGTSSVGGSSNQGVVFKINTDGTGFTKLAEFNSTNGSSPNGTLSLSGSTLYGSARNGGTNGTGRIFKVNTDGTGFASIYDLGSDPQPNVCNDIILVGSVLYGTTVQGGTGGFASAGVLFKIGTDGATPAFTVVMNFTGPNGNTPEKNPLMHYNGVLYGMTTLGGGGSPFGVGSAYKVNTDGTGYQEYIAFNSGSAGGNGANPDGGLALAGTTLYGLTPLGGANGYGYLFSVHTDGSNFTDLLDFNGTAMGIAPGGTVTLTPGGLYGTTSGGGGINGIGIIFKNALLLPIELVSFNASCENGRVRTSWTTATETNNDFFNLEKSEDGINFKTLAIVKGAGNSSQKLCYSTIDNEPYSGISYYRLGQTDFDGKYSYSKIVAVDCSGQGIFPLNVFPNPFNSENVSNTSLTLSGLEKNVPLLIVLQDVLGKAHYSKMLITDNNGILNVDLAQGDILTKGMYLITAAGNDKLYNKKIIIR